MTLNWFLHPGQISTVFHLCPVFSTKLAWYPPFKQIIPKSPPGDGDVRMILGENREVTNRSYMKLHCYVSERTASESRSSLISVACDFATSEPVSKMGCILCTLCHSQARKKMYQCHQVTSFLSFGTMLWRQYCFKGTMGWLLLPSTENRVIPVSPAALPGS